LRCEFSNELSMNTPVLFTSHDLTISGFVQTIKREKTLNETWTSEMSN